MGATQSRSNISTSERARRAAGIPGPSSTYLPVRSSRSSVGTIGSATSLGQRQAKESSSSAPTNYSGDSARRMSIGSSRTLKQTLLALRRRRYTHDPSLLSERDKILITESWEEMRSRCVVTREFLILIVLLQLRQLHRGTNCHRLAACSREQPGLDLGTCWHKRVSTGRTGSQERSVSRNGQRGKHVSMSAVANCVPIVLHTLHLDDIQVRRFLNKLITDRSLNIDAIKYESARLGERHRKYFDDGAQMIYWDSFVGALTAVIELSQYELAEERKRRTESHGRRRSRDSQSTSSSSRRSSSNSTTSSNQFTLQRLVPYVSKSWR